MAFITINLFLVKFTRNAFIRVIPISQKICFENCFILNIIIKFWGMRKCLSKFLTQFQQKHCLLKRWFIYRKCTRKSLILTHLAINRGNFPTSYSASERHHHKESYCCMLNECQQRYATSSSFPQRTRTTVFTSSSSVRCTLYSVHIVSIFENVFPEKRLHCNTKNKPEISAYK